MSKVGGIIIEGHVQGLSNTRSLGNEGIPVYVIDKTNCIARHSKYCKKFFYCPDFLSNDFAYFLIDLAEKENIRDWVLIPSNDHAVYTISKHKEKLEKYYKVITPNLETIGKIYDKSKLFSVAEGCNVPIPKTQYFTTAKDSLIEPLSFPILTKGKNGLSFYKAIRKKALLAKSDNVLKKQLELISDKYNLESTFSQELIPFEGTNRTISYTAFCIDGEVRSYWMGEKLREHPLRFGTATFTRSIFVLECHNQSMLLLEALNYTGVCEVEYIFDPRTNQYKLIEINPRTWLWVGLAKACGVDYAKMIYCYMNQEEFIYPHNYELDKYWINPISDAAYAFISMLTGKLNPLTYFSSILKKQIINALFVKGDYKPGIAYILSIFSYLRNR